MSSTTPSTTQDSPPVSSQSLCSVPDDVHYPLSSSTVFLSSPLLQTPEDAAFNALRLAKDNGLKRLEDADGAEKVPQDDRAEMCSIVPDLARSRDQFSACSSHSGASYSSGFSVSEESNSGKPAEVMPMTDGLPRYYSLESYASQLAFSRHLEQLLLAVLEERGLPDECSPSGSCDAEVPRLPLGSLYALDPGVPAVPVLANAVNVTSPTCSGTLSPQALITAYAEGSQDLTCDSSGASPAEGSPATALNYGFVYVQVDEHDDDSDLYDDSDGSSEASCGTPSVVAALASGITSPVACQPSTHATQAMRTPSPVQNMTVPQAPRKSTHNTFVQSSSPIRPHHGRRLAERGHVATSDYVTSDYMRVDSVSPPQDREGGSAYMHKNRATNGVPPQMKKRKHPPEPTAEKSVTLASRFLAKEPASLRRAASLRSEVSVSDLVGTKLGSTTSCNGSQYEKPSHDDQLHGQVPMESSLSGSPGPDNAPQDISCAPTQVSTPDPRRRFNDITPSDSPLPLIAPPAYELIPIAPLSVCDFAALRIAALIKKDGEERAADGLSDLTALVHKTISNEIAGTTPVVVKQELEEPRPYTNDTTHMQTDSGVDENSQFKIGIDESFRMKVVQWMLDVRFNMHASLSLLLNCCFFFSRSCLRLPARSPNSARTFADSSSNPQKLAGTPRTYSRDTFYTLAHPLLVRPW